MYNIDNTIFDKLQLPDYHFPRSIEYEDLFLIEGWTLDKQTLIDNILLECAELDTLYTNPDFLKFAIGAWCRKEFPVWKALYETLFYKYNPIWNKDGTIKETSNNVRRLLSENNKTQADTNIINNSTTENITDNDTTNRSENGTDISTNNRTENSTNAETENRNGVEVSTGNKENSGSENTQNTNNNTKIESGNNETVNKVSAYDETSTWSNRELTDIADNKTGVENGSEVGTKSNTGTENSNENKVNTETLGKENSGTADESENGTNIRSNTEINNRDYNRERTESGNSVNVGNSTITDNNDTSENNEGTTTRIETGNIGVTTTQQMIEAERELVKFNIYDFIIDSFKARFCILVY